MNNIKEAIRAYVERLRDEHEKAVRACPGLNVVAMTHGGAQKVCDEILAFIDCVPDEQLSKDLEEAALHYATYTCENGLTITMEAHKDAFIAGAKWQKEQMLEDAVDGEVVKIFPEGAASIHYQAPCGIGEMAYFCKAEALKDGDKVKVIIVKEEE